jgi:hypothetical protein
VSLGIPEGKWEPYGKTIWSGQPMLKPAPYILTLAFMLLLTSCFGLGTPSKKKLQQQSNQSQQQGSQGSTIDQELNKHYQMYKEMQGYEKQQEENVIKQSEARMKTLGKEPVKEKSAKVKKKKIVKKKKKTAKK